MGILALVSLSILFQLMDRGPWTATLDRPHSQRASRAEHVPCGVLTRQVEERHVAGEALGPLRRGGPPIPLGLGGERRFSRGFWGRSLLVKHCHVEFWCGGLNLVCWMQQVRRNEFVGAAAVAVDLWVCIRMVLNLCCFWGRQVQRFAASAECFTGKTPIFWDRSVLKTLRTVD